MRLIVFLKTRWALRIPKSAKDWATWEKEGNPAILKKHTFVVDKRFFGYATEDKAEADKLANQFHHIVYTDRISNPDMAAVDGTQKLHSVVGSLEMSKVGDSIHHKLAVANMPCVCLSCRKVVDLMCELKHIRQERILWACEQKERPPQPPRNTEHDSVLEQVSVILAIDKVSVAVLKHHLRLRNEATSGVKNVLAKRLLDYETRARARAEMPGAPPPQLPLAVTYLTNGSTELDDAGSDQEE